MKKVIKLEDLGCASCASKIEDAIAKLDGVTSVRVNFMGQKMTLETQEGKFEAILAEAKKIAKRIEPDLVILA